MIKCDRCGKKLIFKKRFYIYPGQKKGSLRITGEKMVCKDCFIECTTGISGKDIADKPEFSRLLSKRNYKTALNVLEEGFDEKSSGDWYIKGNLLNKLNKPLEEVLRCYDEALHMDSHHIKAWYRKGHVLFLMDRYIDASRCFENAVLLEGSHNIGHVLTGWAFSALFSCMMSWIYAFEETDEGSARQIRKIRDEWIKKCVPLLTNVMPVYKDETGNLKYVTLVPGNLNKPQFIEYCKDNFYEILESIEPRIFAEFVEIGQRH